MQIQVFYQNLKCSSGMEKFILKKVAKLDRYLSRSCQVLVSFRATDEHTFSTSLAIHHTHHDYAFTAEGENLYESFSLAMEKATRTLSEQKRNLRDRINKRFFSVRQEAV
jgi:ribosomal subunit interface protein